VIPSVLLGSVTLPPDLAWMPPWATVATSMFLHGGLGHLLGNMLFLWIYGNNVKDAMGHARFLFFYLLCGIAAVFAQVLPDPTSSLPMVGASGAISGVLGDPQRPSKREIEVARVGPSRAAPRAPTQQTSGLPRRERGDSFPCSRRSARIVGTAHRRR